MAIFDDCNLNFQEFARILLLKEFEKFVKSALYGESNHFHFRVVRFNGLRQFNARKHTNLRLVAQESSINIRAFNVG